jgi:membrane-associated phospholipid phosphatase
VDNLYSAAVPAESGNPERNLGKAPVQRVASQRNTASTLAEALRELGAVDRAVYDAVAHTPTTQLDGPVRRLSDAANHSRLWLGLAAAIALFGGRRGRRAAGESVISIGVTSAIVNLGIKPLADRRRPERAGPGLFQDRHARMPASTSFPSGHAASAFAFAYSIGQYFPLLAVPVRLLAGAVAYSRVHTGVHYPSDVVIGSIVGAGTAAMVATACDRLLPTR